MKAIVFFILFSLGSICCFGQHDFSIKPLPKIEFDDYTFDHDTSMFGLGLKSPVDSILNYYQIPGQEKDDIDVSKLKEMYFRYYRGNMPIAKIPEGNWNMPIAVPDSSIHYFIKNGMSVPVSAVKKK